MSLPDGLIRHCEPDYGLINQDILIVDVREPDEVALGSIPSSVSLPLSQLRDALDKNFSPGEFQKVSC